ncbi:Bll7858 protein [Actinomycetales bacterium JB111]|nr:Bll7858 protein [Actinomycetales bacterium JB111]
MGSTNYTGTFIQVAEDCPVTAAEQPPAGGRAPSVAALQYALVSARPYELTSDDVLFDVHATRQGIEADARAEAREAFFAKDQACLRASPLAKRYGWGFHHDGDGRVALVPLGSTEYEALAADPEIKQLKAMRSRRA